MQPGRKRLTVIIYVPQSLSLCEAKCRKVEFLSLSSLSLLISLFHFLSHSCGQLGHGKPGRLHGTRTSVKKGLLLQGENYLYIVPKSLSLSLFPLFLTLTHLRRHFRLLLHSQNGLLLGQCTCHALSSGVFASEGYSRSSQLEICTVKTLQRHVESYVELPSPILQILQDDCIFGS